jgi:hypothetical protein
MDFTLRDLNFMLDDVALSVECEVVEGVDIPVSDSVTLWIVALGASVFVTVLKIRMLVHVRLCLNVSMCFCAHMLMHLCVFVLVLGEESLTLI